ncbi:MAG: hypothetical protein EON59_04375 [Alphaproteobacteria bacterium]|nr:MAG: hypothetical protein EON59_04375 [Alphaproteobacteria bacterium]
MNLYNDKYFERTDDAHSDAEALCGKYRLRSTGCLANILMWAEKPSYDEMPGADSERGQRPLAAELQAALRAIATHASRVRAIEKLLFEGASSLAFVDIYDVEGAGRVMAGIEATPDVEREWSLSSNLKLAKLIVRPLAEFWISAGGPREPLAFTAFVRDCLSDRWYFRAQVLRDAIDRVVRSIGLRGFDHW